MNNSKFLDDESFVAFSYHFSKTNRTELKAHVWNARTCKVFSVIIINLISWSTKILTIKFRLYDSQYVNALDSYNISHIVMLDYRVTKSPVKS